MSLTLSQFNALVEVHGATLYRVAYRLLGDSHEAEDVVQETFRSAWTGRDRFEPERNSDRAWLTSILRRRAADYWRKPRPPVVLTGENEVEPPQMDISPDSMEYGDAMQHALDQLSEDLRTALLLVVVGELTHQEAANELNLPLGTILSRVSRARTKLREILGNALAVQE